MKATKKIIDAINADAMRETFLRLYTEADYERQKERYITAIKSFEKIYGGGDREIRIFSAPGRTEICGNHTDHQRGRVLAASVNLDIICIVAKNDEYAVKVKSEGHNQDIIDLRVLAIQQAEKNKASSLIRGVAARFDQLGYNIGGFDAYTTSDVLKGSGLSSSAAFEVAIGTIFSHLFNDGEVSPVEIAQIGQYAENYFFDKPSGLMDQMASSVGGFVQIDFKNPKKTQISPVSFDFASSGYTLCIVDTKGNHSDLTGEYALIPAEMRSVAEFFGKQYLREVNEVDFYSNLPEVRTSCGDRAALRAMHFFGDNQRVLREASALRSQNFDKFKSLVIESGRSSSDLLQNIFATPYPQEQGLSIALALSEMILSQKGAWRVHGGGFAGTIQAFVPNDMLSDYRALIEKIFGSGSCYELTVRPYGGIEVKEDING